MSFREIQIKHDMPLIDNIIQGKFNWIQSLIIAITSYLKLLFLNEDKIATTSSFLTHFSQFCLELACINAPGSRKGWKKLEYIGTL